MLLFSVIFICVEIINTCLMLNCSMIVDCGLREEERAWGAPSPTKEIPDTDMDGQSTVGGDDSIMSTSESTAAPTIYSTVKLNQKERGYDEAFQEFKRSLVGTLDINKFVHLHPMLNPNLD